MNLQHILTPLYHWFPATKPLRLLSIGCGVADEAAALLDAVDEFVGVDLDEMAIAQARVRWPQATFHCADAASLGNTYDHYFQAILLHRPDLLAQPDRWRQVFAALPRLLEPQGRMLVTLMGETETATARRWLEEEGAIMLFDNLLAPQSSLHLLVVETRPTMQAQDKPLTLIQLDDDPEGLICDPFTGECLAPAPEVNDVSSA